VKPLAPTLKPFLIRSAAWAAPVIFPRSCASARVARRIHDLDTSLPGMCHDDSFQVGRGGGLFPEAAQDPPGEKEEQQEERGHDAEDDHGYATAE
jgi:hypothetical protein